MLSACCLHGWAWVKIRYERVRSIEASLLILRRSIAWEAFESIKQLDMFKVQAPLSHFAQEGSDLLMSQSATLRFCHEAAAPGIATLCFGHSFGPYARAAIADHGQPKRIP